MEQIKLMRFYLRPIKWVMLTEVFCLATVVFGHDVPSQLPEPRSVREAWNVIEASSRNINNLIEGNLLRDVTFQIANADSSLKFLATHGDETTTHDRAKAVAEQLMSDSSDLIGVVRDKTSTIEVVRARWGLRRGLISTLEGCYPPGVVNSEVYICPMHPLDRHVVATDECSICSMGLIRRRLPASSVYEKPGEPTFKLSVLTPPLVVGKQADVTIRLSHGDGSPVVPSDLLVMHTQRIHLLINDASLTDYHHEHPTQSGIPGEYKFTFTPTKPGPYRIWADVVPAANSTQEYVIQDIPSDNSPEPLTDKATISTAVVNGRTYLLKFNTDDKPIYVGQTVLGTISVSNADGSPCVSLEPIMNAFAHIVGFNEDRKTVLHIHPSGKEPVNADEWGGPAFAFKFYSPTPGFFRLYGQVQIDGVSQLPAFGVTVLPVQSDK